MRVAAGLTVAAAALLVPQLTGVSTRASASVARASAASLVTQSFSISGADSAPRLVVGCPGNSVAYGGGMINNQPFGADGTGIYPRSYERLGVQHGWHITVNYVAPGRSAPSRGMTVQGMWAARSGPVHI